MTYGSCFAGIEGFGVGLSRAGMKGLWHIEIDANCRKLIRIKFPGSKEFVDITAVHGRALPWVDLIAAGFPCQDLSIAGKRAGLAGARSGLFYHLTRIAHEMSVHYKRPAPDILWENVPGLHTSDQGRDFARVLLELARLGYHGAWRTFDAQYFGLAQRRRRVFGLFTCDDTGAARCAQILSLGEGLRGHPAPGKKARERVAGTLTRGALDGSGACGGDGRDGLLVAAPVAGGSGSRGHRVDADTTENLIAGTLPSHASGSATQREVESGLLVIPGNPLVSPGTPEVTPTGTRRFRTASSGPAGDECQNLIVFAHQQITSPENRSKCTPGEPAPSLAGGKPPVLAFGHKDSGNDVGELSPTLRACSNPNSNISGGGTVAIAFKPSHYTRDKDGAPAEVTPPFSADADKGDQDPLVFQTRMVRRLTPRECERLQGFPDDWTAGFSDAVRYRMLGNAVAVPCAEWIGRRYVKFNRLVQPG